MVKAVEGKVGLTRAVEIWKELGVEKFNAGQSGAWDERELSKKTWEGCNTDSDYDDNTSHYQRLNTMIINHFSDMSQKNNQEYPLLMRRLGKIGMMSNSLGIIEVNRNIHLSGTSAVKALNINKGKSLGIDVPARITSDLMGKAVALGFKGEIAKEFINSNVNALKQLSMTPEERKSLSNEIAGSIIDSFNQNPQITQQDQKHQDKFGDNDSLSTNNPNVTKKEE